MKYINVKTVRKASCTIGLFINSNLTILLNNTQLKSILNNQPFIIIASTVSQLFTFIKKWTHHDKIANRY